jgi:hypothetical protein
MLRGVATDVIPRRLRSNEDVHLDLNARIAVNCTESDSMYFALVRPTERGTAGLAEAQTPSRSGLILSQIVFPTDPREGTRSDFRVRGACAAKRLSTPRAVAASTAAERRGDSVTNPTAKTATGQGHRFSPYRSGDVERGSEGTPGSGHFRPDSPFRIRSIIAASSFFGTNTSGSMALRWITNRRPSKVQFNLRHGTSQQLGGVEKGDQTLGERPVHRSLESAGLLEFAAVTFWVERYRVLEGLRRSPWDLHGSLRICPGPDSNRHGVSSEGFSYSLQLSLLSLTTHLESGLSLCRGLVRCHTER